MGKQEGVNRGSDAETHSAGCISSFFHLFHFHPFNHFSFQHQPRPPSSNAYQITISPTNTLPSKGTEAPRNSLEFEDNSTKMVMVGSTISKQDQSLEIPKNSKLFIKTRTQGIISSSNMVMNDMSPGTKTPTLVARLMGLDLLPPETLQSPSSSSPSSSSITTITTTTTSSSCLSSTKLKQVNPRHHLRPQQQNNVVITKARHSMDDRITASRFLPEPPPISSARRSDVEHRPSLHINKENIASERHLMELPRFSFSKLKFEDSGFNNNSKSPRQYAKQIVKQMRESVLSGRKLGSDITNTVQNNNSEKKKQEGEVENVVGPFMKSKKSPRTCSLSSSSDELIESSPGKISNNNNTPSSSCSPRLKFMNKPSSTMAKDNQPQVVSRLVLANSKPKLQQEATLVQQKQRSSSLPKCKKAANEKFSSAQLKKQDKFVRNNKQHESFVRPLLLSPSDKKSKRSSSHHHPLFINLLNSTPPATKLPQKQVCDARDAKYYCNTSQLFSGSSQTYKKEATTSLCIQRTTSTPTSGESNIHVLDKTKITCESMFNNNGPEFEYVSSMLSRTNFPVKKGTINNTSSVSVSLFHQCLSPKPQPLDPSFFHLLEQQYHSQNNNHNPNNPTGDILSFSSIDKNFRPYKYDLGVQYNRRLLFDLVNETLVDAVEGSEEKVWESIIGRIEKGNKKCEFLEDIDALVEMEDDTMKKRKVKSEEEGEAIIMVAEIEGNIMDTLLHETVMMVTECCFCCCS